MLRNWLEAVIERLSGRMLGLVAAKLDARLEIELAAVHAELLKEADRYRCELGEGAGAINQRLVLLAEGLGMEQAGPQALLPSPSKPNKKPADKKDDSAEDKKRGRGRPRKPAQPTIPADYVEVQA